MNVGDTTKYRGHEIVKRGDTNFYITGLCTACGSMWSCISYIDEYLQP